MESEAASDNFIADVDEDASASDSAAPDSPRALAEALSVPGMVQQILARRRTEDHGRQEESTTEGSRADTCSVPTAGPNARPSPEDWTEKLRDFSEEVRLVQARSAQAKPGLCGLEVRTFLDLQGYDLDVVADKRRRALGSTQLMYMFYSRIYEKLVGKQCGVDVPLFAPIDFGERQLGFRAILDWAQDFKLCPYRVGRRELERIYATVHPGPGTPQQRFESKITYAEFLDFIALCGEANDASEPMDRSRSDGSRTRGELSRLERVRRLAQYLSLSNSKKVRVVLHNAYRDTHFWKLSNGADFEKEARAAEMRARPQWNVETLPSGRQLDAPSRKYLQQFTWVPDEHTWEEFEAPVLDMGTAVAGGAAKCFRIEITNRGLQLARVRLEAVGVGPLRLPWRDAKLSPGQSADVSVELVPVECGEWCGQIVASAAWTAGGGSEEVTVPTYSRVLHPQAAAPGVVSRLPRHAPRPFRPGSAKRVIIDPAGLTNRQMRAPTPHRSRPGSAASGAVPRPPRPPSSTRAASASRHSGVIRDLRLLALGQVQGACALPPATPVGAWQDRAPTPSSRATRSSKEAYAKSRPHSAPSSSPQPPSLSARAGYPQSSGSSRPRSASGGPSARSARLRAVPCPA